MHNRFLSVAVALCTMVAVRVPAATLEVGPLKQFQRVEHAVAAARPGDIIEVYPRADGRAYDAVGVLVDKPRLTIRAAGVEAGERITLSGAGFEHSGRGRTPRAIVQFNPGADHGVLDGFELTGASNQTRNGAGVRINQANHITIRNCDIHGNEMGIMSNGNAAAQTAVDQRIENCAIHHNGDPASTRFHHNLYLGGTSVTVRFCEVHHAIRGHNIKSRARFARVEYSYIHRSANRELDLVEAADTAKPGSDVILMGNIIVKDPQSQGNRTVIHFGQDTGGERDGTLYLIHNTIVTPFVSPVVDLSSRGAATMLIGNIIDDGGRRRNNQVVAGTQRGGASATNVSGVANWFAPGFGAKLAETAIDPAENIVAGQSQRLFVDPERHDYRLRKSWPGIVGAGRPVTELALPQTPGAAAPEPPLNWEFVPPVSAQPRPASDHPDLGAQAFVQP